MEKKLRILEAIGIVLAVTCFTIIWFNIKCPPKAVYDKYEPFKAVPISAKDANYIEWEDNFDTSYIEPVNNCLVVTKK